MGEDNVTLYHGDCLDILPQIPDQSVDAVITDPPYPHIKRDYGYWTTEEWWELVVEGVIPQVRRILKPTGSAVFILQPNSEKVGRLRGWLWDFMSWVCREWNMVQDVWWWNYTMIPSAGATMHGLMRSSVKAIVWCGEPKCFRNQGAVLWTPSHRTLEEKRRRCLHLPSGHSINIGRTIDAVKRRGGVTPFNILMIPNNGNQNAVGHSAGTPLDVAGWWTRYICPPGGVVLDPFMGSGTMGLTALQNGCGFIGIDQVEKYVDIAKQRIEQAQQEMVQPELALMGE